MFGEIGETEKTMAYLPETYTILTIFPSTRNVPSAKAREEIIHGTLTVDRLLFAESQALPRERK